MQTGAQRRQPQQTQYYIENGRSPASSCRRRVQFSLVHLCCGCTIFSYRFFVVVVQHAAKLHQKQCTGLHLVCIQIVCQRSSKRFVPTTRWRSLNGGHQTSHSMKSSAHIRSFIHTLTTSTYLNLHLFRNSENRLTVIYPISSCIVIVEHAHVSVLPFSISLSLYRYECMKNSIQTFSRHQSLCVCVWAASSNLCLRVLLSAWSLWSSSQSAQMHASETVSSNRLYNCESTTAAGKRKSISC